MMYPKKMKKMKAKGYKDAMPARLAGRTAMAGMRVVDRAKKGKK